MSLSKHQRKRAKDSSEFPEGEPVLTFHGPRMRKGRCISVVVEDRKVKYLVRYQSGTGVTPAVVTCPPCAQPRQASRSAQGPESVGSSSKAKGSTSRAGPSTSKAGPSTSRAGPSTSRAGPSTSRAGPSTSKAGPSTSRAGPSPSRAGPSTSRAGPSTSRAGPSTSRAGPSTSKAGPSTSRAGPSPSRAGPSTSKAGPSTSKAGPSTSRAGPSTSKAGPSTSKVGPGTSKAGPGTSRAGPSTSKAGSGKSKAGSGKSKAGPSSSLLGGAIVQGASDGKSGSSGSVSQGAGGAGTSGPQSSASKEVLYPVVSGWDYEWIPENRVLRYSADQLKQDSDTAIQMSTIKEKQAALLKSRHSTCGGSDKGDHGDPGEGSTSGMMQPPPKRSRERVRSRASRPWGLSSRGDAGDPKQDSTGRFEVEVNLPKALRPLIVQDWELVTLGKKLCNLPAKITVDAILSEYLTFPLNCRTRDKRYAVCGLVSVIKKYFNVILSTQLLYDFERPQYAELVVSYPSCQMSQLYGGAHLLRLFQQLGPMLTCTALDDSSLIVLLSHLQDFLEYLSSNPSLLFIDANDYELASEEYLKAV